MTISQFIASCCTLLGMFTGISLMWLNYEWACYGAGGWIIGYYTFLITSEYEQKEDNTEGEP
jgi:hypothetical protein